MAPADERERVFVYGTLRRGASRDASVHFPGAEFLAPARVRGTLFDFGPYPGLRFDAAAGWVTGEIFAVTAPALAGLDDWEGFDPAEPDGGDYRRVRVTVDRDGVAEECWAYEVRATFAAGRPAIAGGDWNAHVALRDEPSP